MSLCLITSCASNPTKDKYTQSTEKNTDKQEKPDQKDKNHQSLLMDRLLNFSRF